MKRSALLPEAAPLALAAPAHAGAIRGGTAAASLRLHS